MATSCSRWDIATQTSTATPTEAEAEAEAQAISKWKLVSVAAKWLVSHSIKWAKWKSICWLTIQQAGYILLISFTSSQSEANGSKEFKGQLFVAKQR